MNKRFMSSVADFILSRRGMVMVAGIGVSLVAGSAMISADTRPGRISSEVPRYAASPTDSSEGVIRLRLARKNRQASAKEGVVRIRPNQGVTRIQSNSNKSSVKFAKSDAVETSATASKQSNPKADDMGVVRLGEWIASPKPTKSAVRPASATTEPPRTAKEPTRTTAKSETLKTEPKKAATTAKKRAVKSKPVKKASSGQVVTAKQRLPVPKEMTATKLPRKSSSKPKQPQRRADTKSTRQSTTKTKRPGATAHSKPKPIQPAKKAPPFPDLNDVFTELPERHADKDLTPQKQLSLDAPKPARINTQPTVAAKPKAAKPAAKPRTQKPVIRYQPPKEVKLSNLFPEFSEEAADKQQAPAKSIGLEQYSRLHGRNTGTNKPVAKANPRRPIVRPIPDTEKPGRFDVGQPFTELSETDVDKAGDTEPELFFSKYQTPLRVVDGKLKEDPAAIESTVHDWNNTPKSRRIKLQPKQPAARRPRPAPIARKTNSTKNTTTGELQHIATQTKQQQHSIRRVATRQVPQVRTDARQSDQKPAESKDKFLEELKPVTQITVSIAANISQGVPKNVATAAFENRVPNKNRDYNPRKWESSEMGPPDHDFYNQPLYFEDANLERCGYSLGRIQPVVSALYFFGTVPLLPYKMVVDDPDETVHSLGFCPPGRRYCYTRNYLPPWQWDAALVEAGVIAGGIYVIP